MHSIDDCEIESRKTYQMKLLGFDFAKLIISFLKSYYKIRQNRLKVRQYRIFFAASKVPENFENLRTRYLAF